MIKEINFECLTVFAKQPYLKQEGASVNLRLRGRLTMTSSYFSEFLTTPLPSVHAFPTSTTLSASFGQPPPPPQSGRNC